MKQATIETKNNGQRPRADEQAFSSFTDFWPYYLAEHSRPATRALHAVGTTISTVLVIGLLVARAWLWLPLPLVIGYGFAWIGHFFIEHNRPATFQHPLWSFIGDYKMLALMLTGRLGAELKNRGQRSEVNRSSEFRV